MVSVPCLQQPATCPCLELDGSNPRHLTISNPHFNIIFPSILQCSKRCLAIGFPIHAIWPTQTPWLYPRILINNVCTSQSSSLWNSLQSSVGLISFFLRPYYVLQHPILDALLAYVLSLIWDTSYFNICTVHSYYFVQWANQCTINLQIIQYVPRRKHTPSRYKKIAFFRDPYTAYKYAVWAACRILNF
jgi:hypothetical protein